jgi:hypothetical protein
VNRLGNRVLGQSPPASDAPATTPNDQVRKSFSSCVCKTVSLMIDCDRQCVSAFLSGLVRCFALFKGSTPLFGDIPKVFDGHAVISTS